MVAVIKTGQSIRRTFLYNENKLKIGAATLLQAQNYPLNADQLTPKQRLQMLLHQAALNDNVKLASMHISLNFDSKDKLDSDKLRSIAERYMDGIGYGGQPYLVYRHTDAGHPHIHIVSVNVRADGSRIDTFNIGRNQSETTRRIIEKDFSLIKASRKNAVKPAYELRPVEAQKVSYGKTETKRAITVVLEYILANYKCASLAELNAVLQQYNVLADRGSKDSRTYQSGGLIYRVLDEAGNPVGVPVKASALYNKPTLRQLESFFTSGEVSRTAFKADLAQRIDQAFRTLSASATGTFSKALRERGIVLVPRQNAEGRIYGLTYVDTKNKTVFNGSDLKKGYSAKGLENRLAALSASLHKDPPGSAASDQGKTANSDDNRRLAFFDGPLPSLPLLEALLDPEPAMMTVPYELSGKAKKKQRKNTRLKL